MGKSKFLFAALVGVLFAMPLLAHTNSYSLADALKKKLITASFYGRKGASTSYYGGCITLKIKNISSQNLSLDLESGRRLNCIYDSVQDLLVTREERMALLPSQTQELTIYAMCSQKHDRSPGSTSVYHLGTMAESQLVQLTLLIERYKSQDYTGQQAVWVMTDGQDPSTITGVNQVAVNALRDYVSGVKAKNKPIARQAGFIYDYSYPKQEENSFTIEGDLDWTMPYRTLASLYVYDNYGNKIRIIFQDMPYTSGLQKYHYKVTSDDFRPGELYWVRLKTEDKLLKEVAIQMD